MEESPVCLTGQGQSDLAEGFQLALASHTHLKLVSVVRYITPVVPRNLGSTLTLCEQKGTEVDNADPSMWTSMIRFFQLLTDS